MQISKKLPKENIMLVGFPSNGLVGTFTISYLVHHLEMTQVGEIEHPDLPPSADGVGPGAGVEQVTKHLPATLAGERVFALASDQPCATPMAAASASIVGCVPDTRVGRASRPHG